MADAPPPDLSELGAELPPDRSGSLAELWRNLWPWDDLSAKSPPARYLDLGREIMPVLAALVASGGAAPRLLTADDTGRLATATSPYVVDRFLDSASASSPTIKPASPGLYAPGMFLILASHQSGSGFGGAQVVEVQTVSATTIDIDPQPITSYVPGDYIMIIPPPANFGQPPPAQAPNLNTLTTIRVAAGITNLWPGQFRQLIRVFYAQIVNATALAGNTSQIADTAGNVIFERRSDTIGDSTAYLGGVPVGPGVGLDFHTFGAFTAHVYVSASVQSV